MQRFLNALPYNTEPPPDPATLRSFRGVVRHRTANCLEAALTAAVILEQHGYPPLVMSLESIDGLDHVIFVYRHARPLGLGRAIARSGLHGRKPVFRTLRHLAQSYFDPFIDITGWLKAYGVVDLRVLGGYDWRLSRTQRLEGRAAALRRSRTGRSRARDARVERLRARYIAFRRAHRAASRCTTTSGRGRALPDQVRSSTS